MRVSGAGGPKENGGERQPAPAQSDPKYREIVDIDVGLKVTHSPSPAKAKRDRRAGTEHVWIFETSVEPTGEPVTVTEFGAIAWADGQWVFSNFTGDPFTAQDFAEWYSCPDAKVEPGKKFTGPKNWGGGDGLRPGKALLYFVGVTASGKKVKGEAVIEQSAEMER